MIKRENTFLAIGTLLIVTGIVVNKWLLAFIFSLDGNINAWKMLLIDMFDILCIISGCLLVVLRRKIKWPEIILLIVTSTACIVILEIGLNLVENESQFKVFKENPNGTGSYRLIPNLDYRFDYEINGEKKFFIIKTNSRGMRWKEVSIESPDKRERIAFVGDSFTFGESADRVENSFVGVFERLIDPKKYEVLNFGVDGYGLDDMELQIKEDILPYGPSHIILMTFNGNDFRDTYLGLNKFDVSSGFAVWNMDVINAKIPKEQRGGRYYGGRVGGDSKEKSNRGIKGFLKKSKIVEYLKKISKVVYKNTSLANNIEKGKSDIGNFNVSNYFTSFTNWSRKIYNSTMLDAQKVSIKTLDRIVKLCRDHEISLMIVAIPFEEQVYAKDIDGIDDAGVKYDTRLPQKYIENFSLQNEIPFLDLLPILRTYIKEQEKPIYPDTFKKGGDIHFNNHGHEIVGRYIYDWFKKNCED